MRRHRHDKFAGSEFIGSRQAGREAADSREEVRNDIRIQKTSEPDVLQTSDGRLTLSLPIHITLFDLAVDPPASWDEQRK